jgi:16S rRNA G966 N2-methylase RsmD
VTTTAPKPARGTKRPHAPKADADPGVLALLDDSGGPARRPLPASVTASKGGNAYQVHTYPTKVPPGAIEPFVLASTKPDATVLDPFCGSGMTGVAALNTGRRALLSDLAPGAVHLAHNLTHPVDARLLVDAAAGLTAASASTEAALYGSACPTCGSTERLRHLVWSDVHSCGRCGHDIRVWDASDESGHSARTLTCPACNHQQSRSGKPGTASVPVEKAVACTQCRKLQRGPADPADLALLADLACRPLTHWIPSVPLGPDREMYRRSALQLRGIHNVADFWSHRSQLALGHLWNYVETVVAPAVRPALRLAFTNTAWHATRMRRYNAYGGQRPMTGTLYVPQLVAEGNVYEIFRHQVAQVARFYASHPCLDPDGISDAPALARQSSAADLSWLPTGSVDYVFTDPPFGANLFYGDCNLVWESWLGTVTDTAEEMVVNRSLPTASGGKTMEDYENLLAAAFSEVRRVLNPEGRASVVFHNADDHVWSALLAATDRAGLVQTDVSVLDKVQRSMKGYKGRSGAELVPFYDLVITYSPGVRAELPRLNGAGEVALQAVRRHLDELPTGTGQDADPRRSLEYLYSLSVGAVISGGGKPTGLSFKALRSLLNANLSTDGRHFYVR